MRVLRLVALLAALFSQEAHALVLSVGSDWPPYNCRTESGEAVGIDVDMSLVILETAGLDMKVEVLPSPRGQAYLHEGLVDVLPGATFSEERAGYAWFSVPYREEVVAILVRKGEAGKWPLKHVADIGLYSGLRVGVSTGAFYGKEFEIAQRDGKMASNLYHAVNLQQRLRMLQVGRLDMVVGDKYSMLHVARGLGTLDAFEFHPLVVNRTSVHLMFSRKSVDKAVVDKVDVAITSLKKSGRLQAYETSDCGCGFGASDKLGHE